MPYLILPDDFPVSEWMLTYAFLVGVILIFTLFSKKGFLCKYLIFVITAIISINIFSIGYKIDNSHASHGARYKLNQCAIAVGGGEQKGYWFAITQHSASKRYEVYRQLYRCNKARLIIEDEIEK